MKEEIVIGGDFSIPFSSVDRSSRQLINKETANLNNTIEQKDLTAICGTFHLTVAECTFFSNVHRSLSKTDHILGYDTNLNKFKYQKIPYEVSFLNTTVLN